MACVTDVESLSPDERLVLEAIQTKFLSAEQINEKTNLPLYRVRSIIRKFIELDTVLELNETYKAK